jgi:plasmid stabilization system protein ParE
MSEYRLSLDAEQDIGEMYRRGFWLFGEQQADKFYNQLFDSLELLAVLPVIWPSGRGYLS